MNLLVKFNPGFLPRASAIRVDGSVLLFATVVSVLSGVAFGLIPALAVSHTKLYEQLKSGRGEANAGRRQWGRGVLVAAELAMTVILLVGAGLLARSFWRLMSVDPGFRPDHLLTLSLRVYDEQMKSSFYPDLLDRLERTPGINAAAVSEWGASYVSTADIIAAGHSSDPNRLPVADACFVSADYFRALGAPVLKGRSIETRDSSNAPQVTVISAALAEELWPSENPIGKRLAANYRSLGRATEQTPVTRGRRSRRRSSSSRSGNSLTQGDLLALPAGRHAATAALDGAVCAIEGRSRTDRRIDPRRGSGHSARCACSECPNGWRPS